jgi:Family of unknown function (DUF6074)
VIDFPSLEGDGFGEPVLDWRLAKVAVRERVAPVAPGSADPPQLGQAARTHGDLLPFPLARQRSLVQSLAVAVSIRGCAQGERYLKEKLRGHIDDLHCRYVCDRVVEREVRALESAVRAELWHLTLLRPNSEA